MSLYDTPTPDGALSLRPYQARTVDETRAALQAMPKGERRVMLASPTGSGKTVMAALGFIRAAEARQRRTLFVVASLELLDQALRTFDAAGLRVGVMQAQHERTDMHRLTQVCSQATLRGWLERGKLDGYRVDLVLHDEADQQYRVRDMLAEAYPDAPVVGLSASPFAKGLGRFYGGLVQSTTVAELIEGGHLSPFRVYAPSQPDMKGCETSGRDWKAAAAAARYDDALVADIVSTWQRLAAGRKTLMFATTVAHSKQLVEQFVAAGVNAVHVDGYPDDPDSADARGRFEKVEAFRRGEITILSSVALCSRGFDVPDVSALILARPTKSLSLFWQLVGRGLRTAAGKDDCLILDHAGAHLRHGFVTDPIDMALDDGTRKDRATDAREKGEKLPVPCGACAFMKPAGCFKCPACGAVPERGKEIENVDGELVELKPNAPDVAKGKAASREEKQRWWSELKGYAETHDKSEKWVLAKYRTRFDCWPRQLDDTPAPPSESVRNWLTSETIRYAKSRKAA